MPTWEDIQQARRRLAGVAHRTPVLSSRQFDEASGATVFFKAENLQRAGAFKFRGAYNKIKAETERRPVPAVVAFSSGNHAQAVALVSRLLGIRATVVMPTDAPQAKIDATRGYGAEVVLYDRATQSRDDLAEQICRERGAVLVPPFDDELIMAGQATGAVELLEEVPDLDALVVPRLGRRADRRLGDGRAPDASGNHDLWRRARDGRRHEAVARRRRAGRGRREPDDRRRPARHLAGKAHVPDRAASRSRTSFSSPTRK